MALKNWVVPPLIGQWIDQLHNPTTPEHIKENYKMMLENLREACEAEVTWYNTSRFRVSEKKTRKKKE